MSNPEENRSIHHRVQTGFADSASYDRGRPTYSATIVQTLLEQLNVAGKKGAKILDLGAGTGKFTGALAVRPENFEVIAVEPHGDMRRVLDAKGLPRVMVKDGMAHSLSLDDESMDAVICAQAFHWFDNMDTLHEVHRVLQPHGAFGLVYNIDSFNMPIDQTPSTDWERTASEMLRSHDDDHPRFRHMRWRKIFDEQVKSTPMALIKPSDQLFSLPLGEHTEDFEVHLSKDKLWERYNTYSQIATLQGEERDQTYKKFMDAIDDDKEALNANGEVIMHGYTLALWTTKIPSEGREGLTEVEEPEI